jgi:tetratricopeptide (TPR) repeat protein
MNAEEAAERARSPRAAPRRWAIRLVLATLVPLAVLGLAEAGLRLAGAGHPTGFFVAAEGVGGALAPNPAFGWRFFPRAIARRPEAFVLPEKAPGTVRVFVLGSSAAQGFPDPGIGIARVLEVLLRERFPAARFEVVNAAMVAINSHALVDIARACAAEGQGDVFVVYEGNNEVIGPFGPGTVFAGFTPNRALIRASLWARGLRLGQLFTEAGQGDAPGEWTGMELFLGSRIAADDPRLTRTAEHFRANLADVCRAATSRGKAVLLCTVGVNLRDCAPFASLHRDGLAPSELAAWEAAFAAGSEAEAAGRHAEALEHYESAAALDDRHAELRFRAGRCLLELGRADDARAELAAARDLDALRFRTDHALNEVVCEVAAAEGAGVTLVDVERQMEEPAASAHGIPGSELFLEHCHMTLAGNYLIARAVLDALVPVLPAEARSTEGEPASLERCAELLGLSPWHAARIAASVSTLLERPPFTYQAEHEASLAEARARAAELLAAARPANLAAWIPVLEGELAKVPEDWTLRRRLGDVLAAAGELAGAEAQFRAVVGAVPFDVDAGHALARVLLMRGEVDAAVGEYRRVLASSWSTGSTRAETCLALAELEEQRGRLDVAAALCAEALEEHPSNAKGMAQLGRLELRRQRWAEAERRLRAAVAAAPALAAARLDLARALAAQKHVEAARAELVELVKQEPGHVGAWLALGDAQASLGLPGDSLTSYTTAARLAPGAAETRAKLGSAYLAAGRVDEAVAELTEAARLRPDLPGLQATLRAARERRARDP